MNRAAAEWRRSCFVAALASASLAACSGDPTPNAATPAPVDDVAEVEIPAMAPAEPSVGEPPRELLARSSASVETPAPRPGTLPRVCEEYLSRFEACAVKIPPSGRASMLDAIKQMRSAWAAAAANPETSDTIAAACQQALDAIQQSGMCGP